MLRYLIAVLVLPLLLISAARAADPATEMAEALRLSDVFAVMAAEGQAYGHDIEQEMFPGAGGPAWHATVARIYSPERVLPAFILAFAAELSQSGVATDEMLAFFRSDLGRRLTTLEVSARRALLDDAVEDASRLKLQEMRVEGDPRLDLIEEFVATNDLVEANVTGALNASLAFYLGLADAGALGGEADQADMLAEVWSQEPSIRADTEIWVNSYLAMAYAPISDAELRQYIDFSGTETGQALNRALFVGFDAVFVALSRQLGQAAGGILAGQEL